MKLASLGLRPPLPTTFDLSDDLLIAAERGAPLRFIGTIEQLRREGLIPPLISPPRRHWGKVCWQSAGKVYCLTRAKDCVLNLGYKLQANETAWLVQIDLA